MAVATSYANIYRNCVQLEKTRGIDDDEIPSYSWFLLQFWPCLKTNAKMLHYTGRFKVKRMIQARVLRKHNHDSHYVNAIHHFMQKRAVKYRNETLFLSADAKCKVTVGEPGYQIAAVSRGKKVIVWVNESFQVADHDFSKLSIIPDAILVQQIPEDVEQVEAEPEKAVGGKTNGWFSGQVFYAFKTMVNEGSTAARGVVEMGKIIDQLDLVEKPCRILAITDGGGDRRVDYLSVQKTLISLFLKHNCDEVLVSRTAAGLSYRNPVERIHSIANLGLQAVGIMRKSMNAEHERIIKNLNSNEEIRKVCSSNDSLKEALQESLTFPIDLLKATFSTLSLKDKPFKIAEAATNAELESYKDVLHVFDPDMESLQRKDQLSKYPKFKHFLDTHCTLRTYSFHVYKCENLECEYHSCIRGQPIESFGDPVPFTDQEGVG